MTMVKPCPKCGEDPMVDRRFTATDTKYVVCLNVDCELFWNEEFTPDEWNAMERSDENLD